MNISVERTRPVTVDIAVAWSVMSDMAGYAAHVDGLAETTVVAGAGLGAVRRCVDTSGADWHETCVVWEPGAGFTVEVDVNSYPLKFRTLFSAFRGTWWVEPRSAGTVIGITFEAELRPLARAMGRQIEHRLTEDLDAILASYEQTMMLD